MSRIKAPSTPHGGSSIYPCTNFPVILISLVRILPRKKVLIIMMVHYHGAWGMGHEAWGMDLPHSLLPVIICRYDPSDILNVGTF